MAQATPFRIGEAAPSGALIETRDVAVDTFREWITGNPTCFDQQRAYISANLRELKGCDLACWCPPDGPRHADVPIELANA